MHRNRLLSRFEVLVEVLCFVSWYHFFPFYMAFHTDCRGWLWNLRSKCYGCASHALIGWLNALLFFVACLTHWPLRCAFRAQHSLHKVTTKQVWIKERYTLQWKNCKIKECTFLYETDKNGVGYLFWSFWLPKECSLPLASLIVKSPVLTFLPQPRLILKRFGFMCPQATFPIGNLSMEILIICDYQHISIKNITHLSNYVLLVENNCKLWGRKLSPLQSTWPSWTWIQEGPELILSHF